MAATTVKEIALEGIMLVGVPVSGRWQDLPINVPRAWTKLFAQQPAIAAVAEKTGGYVGVSLALEGDVFSEFVGQVVEGCKAPPEGLTLLEVPANRYVTDRHDGPLPAIADRFQSIYDRARAAGLLAAVLKLDFGYRADGAVEPHDLYVGIEPVSQPRIVAQ